MTYLNRLLAAACFGILSVAWAISPAAAQQAQIVTACGAQSMSTAVPGVSGLYIDGTGNLCTAASVSASVPGFAPVTFGTLTSTASSSASTALPAGANVALQNTSAVDVSCVLDPTNAVATTNKIVVRGGSTVFVTVGSNTKVACINQTGSASNVIALMGGSGLGTNFGGGGSGGGGAITIASGAVASGAYSSGSIASGAMVDLGAQADSTCGTGTGTCSLIALTKYLNTLAASSIPVNVSAVATAVTGHTVAGNTGVDINTQMVNGVAVLTGTGATGTGAQRVTVSTDQATNAGAALVKGGVGVVNGGSFYQAVAASQTATVLQSSTGATGDYLSHCVIYPATTSPGVVTVFDNTNTAATSAILFAGGASSVSNLVPIPVPVGSLSAAGAWKVTTGTNVSVVCYGKFS